MSPAKDKFFDISLHNLYAMSIEKNFFSDVAFEDVLRRQLSVTNQSMIKIMP